MLYNPEKIKNIIYLHEKSTLLSAYLWDELHAWHAAHGRSGENENRTQYINISRSISIPETPARVYLKRLFKKLLKKKRKKCDQELKAKKGN